MRVRVERTGADRFPVQSGYVRDQDVQPSRQVWVKPPSPGERHAPSRTPPLPPLLLSHNLPIPRVR